MLTFSQFVELLLAVGTHVVVGERKDLINTYENACTGTYDWSPSPLLIGQFPYIALDLADFFLTHVTGPENAADTKPIGEELVKLGVLAPLGHEGFKAESGKFYRVIFTLVNVRHALGAAIEAVQELVRKEKEKGYLMSY